MTTSACSAICNCLTLAPKNTCRHTPYSKTALSNLRAYHALGFLDIVHRQLQHSEIIFSLVYRTAAGCFMAATYCEQQHTSCIQQCFYCSASCQLCREQYMQSIKPCSLAVGTRALVLPDVSMPLGKVCCSCTQCGFTSHPQISGPAAAAIDLPIFWQVHSTRWPPTTGTTECLAVEKASHCMRLAWAVGFPSNIKNEQHAQRTRSCSAYAQPCAQLRYAEQPTYQCILIRHPRKGIGTSEAFELQQLNHGESSLSSNGGLPSLARPCMCLCSIHG